MLFGFRQQVGHLMPIFRARKRTFNWVIARRYVDRFECRSGEWRIAYRTVVYDFEWFDEAGTRPINHPTEPFLSHAVREE